MKSFYKQLLMTFLFALCAPAAAFAQTASTTRASIFDCDGSPLEAGFYTVLDGQYVPVSDMAVTRNTSNTIDNLNRLAYKECVLDVIAREQGDAALTRYAGSIIERANEGRGGAPEFVANPGLELKQRASETVLEFIKKYNIEENVCAPFAEQAKVSIARQYMRSANDPASAFRCSLGLAPADQEAFLAGQTAKGGRNALWEMFANPANTPWGASLTANLENSRQIILKNEALLMQWNWGNGFYPREEIRKERQSTGEDRLTRYTNTPAYIVARITEQAITAGFNRLGTTDELGEVTAATFAGLTNQVMTSQGGFNGLSQTTAGGGISYVQQLADLALGQLRDTVADTAIARVRSAIATEQGYAATKQKTKSLLEDAISKLQTAEDQCWAQIIPAVQAKATQGNCTTTGGIGGIGGITTCTPIQLNISTTSEKITSGSIALNLTPGVALQSGVAFTLSADQATGVQSASFSSAPRVSTTSTTTLSIPLGATTAISPGASITMKTPITLFFSGGTLAIKLNPGQVLPFGTALITLNPIAPFAQAIVSLAVGLARPFADPVIASEITPLLDQINQDLVDSANGIVLLRAIETDLSNRDDPATQRDALDRLENLLASNLIHSQRDAQNAERQRAQVFDASQTLLTDTQTSWTSNGNWCEVSNPNVIQAWLDKWKVS